MWKFQKDEHGKIGHEEFNDFFLGVDCKCEGKKVYNFKKLVVYQNRIKIVPLKVKKI